MKDDVTAAEYPSDASIHQLFELQAAQHPQSIAVVFGEQQLRYHELNERANHLAHHVRNLGAGPDVLIGLCIERSVELIVAMLAILKAGSAYVPIDPDQPVERIAQLCKDAQPRAILTQNHLCGRFSSTPVTLFCVDDKTGIGAGESQNLPQTATASNLAYVMYTSGSTGRPKGVLIEQRSVVRLVCGTDYIPFTAERIFLQAAPVAFDASTFEIWGALLHGATLVLLTDKTPTVQSLSQAIARHRVDTLWLTSALFNLIVDQSPELLAPIRYLIVGGDVVSPAHVRRAQAVAGKTSFINGYGPTESTTFALTYPIPCPPPDRLPIGRPIANTHVHILTPELRPAPVGVSGELYIGGAGLARGYLGDEVLTAARFIADPFSEDPTARLYRTGDLARVFPDGNVEFLGRIDQQVKIRGYRIEPGEIENRLAAHPDVSTSVVMAREDPGHDKRLVAYVVLRENARFDAHALSAHLAGLLPDYMMPAVIVPLVHLPLTANGKLDRAALPVPPAPASPASSMAPQGATEQLLAELFCDALKLPQVGRMEDFFALGGNSLHAIRLLNQLGNRLGIMLPLPSLFEARTIAELASRLDCILMLKALEKPAENSGNDTGAKREEFVL